MHLLRSIRYSCSLKYKPLRPLVQEKTLIYSHDPLPKPNVFLFLAPSLAITINNILSQWSLLNTSCLLLTSVVALGLYYHRLMLTRGMVTSLYTNRTFDRFYIETPDMKDRAEIPQNNEMRYTEKKELEISRDALLPSFRTGGAFPTEMK